MSMERKKLVENKEGSPKRDGDSKSRCENPVALETNKIQTKVYTCESRLIQNNDHPLRKKGTKNGTCPMMTGYFF
jgi:hypothetical protein